MADKPTIADAVTVSISCPGYTSEITMPIGQDNTQNFLDWFEMQLGYLKRWKPGATATIKEARPI